MSSPVFPQAPNAITASGKSIPAKDRRIRGACSRGDERSTLRHGEVQRPTPSAPASRAHVAPPQSTPSQQSFAHEPPAVHARPAPHESPATPHGPQSSATLGPATQRNPVIAPPTTVGAHTLPPARSHGVPVIGLHVTSAPLATQAPFEGDDDGAPQAGEMPPPLPEPPPVPLAAPPVPQAHPHATLASCAHAASQAPFAESQQNESFAQIVAAHGEHDDASDAPVTHASCAHEATAQPRGAPPPVPCVPPPALAPLPPVPTPAAPPFFPPPAPTPPAWPPAPTAEEPPAPLSPQGEEHAPARHGSSATRLACPLPASSAHVAGAHFARRQDTAFEQPASPAHAFHFAPHAGAKLLAHAHVAQPSVAAAHVASGSPAPHVEAPPIAPAPPMPSPAPPSALAPPAAFTPPNPAAGLPARPPTPVYPPTVSGALPARPAFVGSPTASAMLPLGEHAKIAETTTPRAARTRRILRRSRGRAYVSKDAPARAARHPRHLVSTSTV